MTTMEYAGFRITSRKVPDRRGRTATAHTEWSAVAASGWHFSHPITAGTLAAVKRRIDKTQRGKRARREGADS